MRLASLARKIKITPSKLSNYLAGEGIDLPNGTNTKLEDAQVALVLEYFDKELPIEELAVEDPIVETIETLVVDEVVETQEIIATLEAVETIEIVDNIDEQTEVIEETESIEEAVELVEHHTLEIEEVVTPTDINPVEPDDDLSYSERAALNADIDVIKAPKIKLQGLTVKGKIELPSPKQKETPKEEESEVVQVAPVNPDKIIYTSGPSKERKQYPKNNRDKRNTTSQNPLEAERKSKAWEEKKAKERKLRQEKELKKKHYETKVVTQIPTTPSVKKPVKKKPVRVKKEKVQTGGNILQKFWRWMNS